MSILGKLRQFEIHQEVELPPVYPGKVASIPIFEDAQSKILAVACPYNDKGGEVYSFDARLSGDPRIMPVPPELLTEENLTDVIEENGTVEKVIFDARGNRLTLLLEHFRPVLRLIDISSPEAHKLVRSYMPNHN